MLLTRLLNLALQGLLRRRLRTTITLASVIVGTAGLLLFIGVAYGLDRQLQQQLGSYEPATVLHVDPPLAPNSTAADAPPPTGLDTAMLARLRTLPHVRDAFAEAQVGGTASVNGASVPLPLRPVPPSYVDGGANVNLLAGHLFSDTGARVMVITVGFAQLVESGPPTRDRAAFAAVAEASPLTAQAIPGAELIGKTLRFTPQGNGGVEKPPADFQVVGVVDGRDSFAYVPYNTGMALLPADPGGQSSTYNAAVVQVDKVQDVATVRQAIDGMHLHIETPQTLAQSLAGSLNIARLVAALIAVLGLALAVINITNSLLAAVTERAGEIGIMKAVGARNWHVGTLFLLESLLLGLSGGALGALLAALLTRILPAIVPFQLPDGPPLALAVPLAASIATVVAVTLLSGLAGLIPALRAAGIDPAAAIVGTQ